MAEEGSSENDRKVMEEAPKLAAVLKDMKGELELVRSRVVALTAKVKAKNYPITEGISYLEAKHLLLIGYCQLIVYYMIRKASGLSIEGHPVVRNLIETRLFLEKIRPIDKKMEYQLQKLTRDAGRMMEALEEKKSGAPQKSEDMLKYRANPEMLKDKDNERTADGLNVYRTVRIAPTVMEDDKKPKEERDARRRDKLILNLSKRGYMKELIDNMEGRPEEIAEDYGNESRELEIYKNQWEDRSQKEEDLFTRVPMTKMEKKKQKILQKSSNGVVGLTDGLLDEIKGLPFEGGVSEEGKRSRGRAAGKMRKRKRRH